MPVPLCITSFPDNCPPLSGQRTARGRRAPAAPGSLDWKSRLRPVQGNCCLLYTSRCV
ncbi:hypothetical protein [Arthrobacter sp. KBS0703]|uniref:hypothetical protein n=1 Tax=Arthrobacter sp. KBS0703 TaxID=1955698 RepID=UPI00163DBF12|nr:hypothetical protein [Arthrobacter sp. KBS0703]